MSIGYFKCRAKPSKKRFVYDLMGLDHFQCRNKRCQSPHSGLGPHHILRRSHGAKDTFEECITLCMACHRGVEEGIKIGDKRLTAREFMLMILEQWVGHPEFRWSDVYNELKRKPDRRIDYGTFR